MLKEFLQDESGKLKLPASRKPVMSSKMMAKKFREIGCEVTNQGKGSHSTVTFEGKRVTVIPYSKNLPKGLSNQLWNEWEKIAESKKLR